MTTEQATEWLQDRTCTLPPEHSNPYEEELNSTLFHLRGLYDEFREIVAEEMAKGNRTAPPKALVAAYKLLQERAIEAERAVEAES